MNRKKILLKQIGKISQATIKYLVLTSGYLIFIAISFAYKIKGIPTITQNSTSKSYFEKININNDYLEQY